MIGRVSESRGVSLKEARAVKGAVYFFDVCRPAEADKAVSIRRTMCRARVVIFFESKRKPNAVIMTCYTHSLVSIMVTAGQCKAIDGSADLQVQ